LGVVKKQKHINPWLEIDVITVKQIQNEIYRFFKFDNLKTEKASN